MTNLFVFPLTHLFLAWFRSSASLLLLRLISVSNYPQDSGTPTSYASPASPGISFRVKCRPTFEAALKVNYKKVTQEAAWRWVPRRQTNFRREMPTRSGTLAQTPRRFWLELAFQGMFQVPNGCVMPSHRRDFRDLKDS